jgi:glycosyltransferase involved in cell wall biosynthesis
MNIHVSVIIPTYNSNATLPRALDSLRAQKFTDMEVLVIDDGSYPLVPTSLQSEYSDINLILIRTNQNLGIVAALNLALENAKGQIIIRLDADDRMLPNRIIEQVAAFKDNAVDVVFSQMLVNGSEGIYFYPLSHEAVSICMLYGNPIPHPCVAIKASVFKNEIYRDLNNTKGLEDYYLWARLIKSGSRFMGLSNYGVDYAIGEHQISRNVAINTEYKESRRLIASLNVCNDKQYKKRISPAVIFKHLKKLKGLDLLAFRQLAQSDLKRAFRDTIDPLKKVTILISFIFLKLMR